MFSIRQIKTSAWVAHPDHPELRVFAEKPTRAELMEEQHKIESYAGHEVAVNPITKEPIRDRNGNLEIIRTPPRVPLWETTRFLTEHIKKAEGLKESDAPIPEIVKGFIETRFDVVEPMLYGRDVYEILDSNGRRIPPERAEEGKLVLIHRQGEPMMEPDGVTPKMARTAFALHLFNKVMSEDTFKTPDPTEEISSSQPISV